MFPLSLTLIFLHLTATLCEYEFNYTVYDTIGTEVFANTTTDISIYKTTHFDCNLFLSENGTLRFRSDYDFNQQFNKLDFSCHFIGNETLLLFFYVHVIDTNDHAPVFYRTSYQLYVDEQFGAVIKDVIIPLPVFSTFINRIPSVNSYVDEQCSRDVIDCECNPGLYGVAYLLLLSSLSIAILFTSEIFVEECKIFKVYAVSCQIVFPYIERRVVRVSCKR